ncbi:MAG: GtrA family protein [Alphaproteobacteria bacterium]
MRRLPDSPLLRFAIVGTIGFVVDAGVLTLLHRAAGIDLYLGRLASFLAAATVTWALNRRFTFRAREPAGPGEWLRWVALMGGGAAINYLVYAWAIAGWPVALDPVAAVAAGSLAGLAWNYLGARRLYRTNGA